MSEVIGKNEEFYDAEVAPVLLDLVRKCEARGMGFIAVVAYAEDNSAGRTVALPSGSPAVLRWLNVLAQCGDSHGVNIDRFLFALMREAKVRGHSSTVLASLGIPLQPEAET